MTRLTRTVNDKHEELRLNFSRWAVLIFSWVKCISRGTSAFARDINLDRVVTGHLDFLNLYIFRVENKIPNESNNVWTRKFLNPERKSCGFKNIRIRVHGPLVLVSIEKIYQLNIRECLIVTTFPYTSKLVKNTLSYCQLSRSLKMYSHTVFRVWYITYRNS